jgi:hypothetical protein
MKAQAAEFSGYAGKFRCVFERRVPLPTSPIERSHGAIRLAFDRFFFQIVPFVDCRFTPADPDLYLDTTVFPIKSEGDQSLPLNCACRKELCYLRLVQQKLSRTLRFVLRMAGALVRLNIRIVEEDLPVLDPRKRVIQIRQAGSDRLDLGAAEFNSRLDLVEDLIVMKGSAIGNDLRGHCGQERQV